MNKLAQIELVDSDAGLEEDRQGEEVWGVSLLGHEIED